MTSLASWIPVGVKDDVKELRQGRVPIQVEVSLRVTVSALLGYILGLGEFPNAVPQSQRALIAMLGVNLSLIFPTLLFSVGAIIFPAQTVVTILACLCATLLLACAAAVGLGLYIAMFFVVSLLLSGARFQKSTGAITAVLIMQVALNSLYLAKPASENGLAFVGSLWTETGVTNPNAAFTNAIVGILWVSVTCVVARILPPFRTARSLILQEWLPNSLEDVAKSVELNTQLAVHANTPPPEQPAMTEVEEEGMDQTKAEVAATTQSDAPATSNPVDLEAHIQTTVHIDSSSERAPSIEQEQEGAATSLEEQHSALVKRLVSTKAVLDDGKIAGMTAFEPRLLRGGPPECSWLVLQKLVKAVDRMILSSLALVEIWKNPDGVMEDLRLRFQPLHCEAAAHLEECAHALKHGGSKRVVAAPTEGNNPDPVEATSTSSKPVGLSDWPKDPRCGGPIDPSGFSNWSDKVVAATNDWMDASSSPDWTNRSCVDNDARTAWKNNLKPCVGAGGMSLIFAIINNLVAALSPKTWRNVFQPPHYESEKFCWCIKFAVGMTALVAMMTYWDAFADLEVPVLDDGELPDAAHFGGWSLIAYAMSTTQTAEGTVKKGLLRLLGTVAGGFWGWVGLALCGEDNAVGLIAWMTVFTVPVAYLGLGRGFSARMGAESDSGFGPGYFLMTQALVVTDVYLGAGAKNDIFVNRSLANGVGIVMAILLAILPVSLYGGNPKFASEVLEREKDTVIRTVRLLLNHGQCNDVNSAAALAQEIDKIREESKEQCSKLLEEANDYYSDSSKIAALPFWQVDPKLKHSLDSLKVLGSWIYTFLGYAVHVLEAEDEERWKQLHADEESQQRLNILLEGLESGSFALIPDPEPCGPDGASDTLISFESKVILNHVRVASQQMKLNRDRLASIKWGILGER